MTLTSIITGSVDYILLVPGISLLNWVFKPRYYEDIDFIMAIVSAGTIYILAVWAVLLNYGVERI